VYLLILWPLLPGSLEVMSGCDNSPKHKRSRIALGIAVAAAVVIVAFHLTMLLVGYFWE